MDYKSYQCDLREKLWCAAVSAAFAGVISWLFYRSGYAMALIIPIYLFYRRQYQAGQLKARRERLLQEFKEGMQAVSTALLAGYSMEHAWSEAEKELCELYGEDSLMYRELHLMNTAIRVNQPLEQVLSEFALRSGCEEIESFAEVFSFAKRSGGNFADIIRTTVCKIAGKIEVEQEIATALAGKKMEGRIMSAMPLLILTYLNLTAGDFLDTLYGNILGITVMSLALGVYAISIKLSEHIMDIQV